MLNQAFRLGCAFVLAAWAAMAGAQRDAPTGDASQEAYELLAREPLYLHSSARSRVDEAAVREAARQLAPMTLKVLVVPQLSDKWKRSGREMRGSYARWLLTKRLALSNAVVIVYTKNGITAYSDRVGDEQLEALSNQAAARATRQDFTPAIVWLAQATAEQARSSGRSKSTGLGLAVGLPVGVVALVLAGRAARRRRELSVAVAPIEEKRHEVLEGISYLDGFSDLLGDNSDTTGLRNARERAYQKYETGAKLLREAKDPAQASLALDPFLQALDDIEQGKKHIEAATGGTKVAFVVPPPQLAPQAPLYEPVANTCYLCSRPGSDDLTAVTLNLDGQKKTVLVCPDDLAELERGGEPRLRGRYLDGRFVPWYMVQGYDPMTSYGTRGFLWDALAMSALMNMVNPFSSVGVVNQYYGAGGSYPEGYATDWGSSVEPSTPEPFGLDQAGDFGGGDFGGSWDSGSSGGDIGGGDFGGGDFGGGDFGGGDF